MCRNVKTLFNLEPPATDAEIRASAEQYVRKISGFAKPSRANEHAFNAAVNAVMATSAQLLSSLSTAAEPRNRDDIARKQKIRAQRRFAIPTTAKT